jgi:hypothetical protein
MQRGRAWLEGIGIAALVLCALAACGSQTRLQEAPARGPLAASKVAVTTTGNAPATVDQSSVTFGLDDSGALVVHLHLTSRASTSESVSIRASLFSSTGALIGDATGGAVNVARGATVTVELNGPAPDGTISSATIELTAQASPTPTHTSPGAISTPVT